MTDKDIDNLFDEFEEDMEFEKKSETMSFRVAESLKKMFYAEVPQSLRAKTFAKFRHDIKFAIYVSRFNPNTIHSLDK